MATFISTSKFERFWRKAQGWFAMQFNGVADRIINAMPKETTEEEIDSMFE